MYDVEWVSNAMMTHNIWYSADSSYIQDGTDPNHHRRRVWSKGSPIVREIHREAIWLFQRYM